MKTIKLTLFLYFLIHSGISHCQILENTWQSASLGFESLNDAVVDPSTGDRYAIGSFVDQITIQGQTYTAKGSDIILMKYNKDNQVLWHKVITDVASNSLFGDDFGTSVTLDNNNVYFVGDFTREKDFNPGNSGGNISTGTTFIAKYTKSGNFLWVKSIKIGGQSNPSCQYDPINNYLYIGGNLDNSNNDIDPGSGTLDPNQPSQPFVLKLTSSGAYNAYATFAERSSLMDIATDNSGNIYATGRLSESNINVDNKVRIVPGIIGNEYDLDDGRVYIAKLNSNLFVNDEARPLKPLGSTVNASVDGGRKLKVDGNSIYLAGRNGDQLYLSKFDLNLNLSWAKFIGGEGQIVAMDAKNNNIYVAGEFINSSISFDQFSFTNSTSFERAVFAKMNSSGGVLEARVLRATNDFIPTAIVVDPISENYDIIFDFKGSTSNFDCLDQLSLNANSQDILIANFNETLWYEAFSNIQGNDLLCASNTSYSIPNLPSNASVQWSVTPSSRFSNTSSSGSTFTTSAYSAYTSGTGFIYATVSNFCGTRIIDKQVKIGRPDISTSSIGFTGGGSTLSQYASYSTSISGALDADYFQWEVPSGWTFSSVYPRRAGTLKPTTTGNHTIKARAYNGCGFNYISKSVCVEGGSYSCSSGPCSGCGPGGPHPQLILYPNPIEYNSQNSILQFSKEAHENHKSLDGKVHIRLFDEKMNLMNSEERVYSRSIPIKTKDLKKGVYLLDINFLDISETLRLVVE